MSKGFHRLPSADPWSNAAIYALPLHKGVVVPDDLPTPNASPVPADDFEPAPLKMTRQQATSAGFTGNSCNECGSMQMVRNGTCEKCNSCGATTGCS